MINSDGSQSWRLRNAWNSASDRAVLAMCAQRLAEAGLAYSDAIDDVQADAFKLHGFEMIEAHRDGAKRLLDLSDVAATESWTSKVDSRALNFMRQDGAVFGIPMAIHQSNCIWTHRALRDELGSNPSDFLAWLRSASRRNPRPLVVGREPWLIGILFETLYAGRGVDAYRRALVDLDPEALGGDATRQTLEELRELRSLTDERGLDTPWRKLLERVDRGDAGAMVMGDWVQASGRADVARVTFDSNHVHIVDFFVPVANESSATSLRVAALLTDSEFQARIAAVKGSAPAVRVPVGDTGADGRVDFPSFTFDQCCRLRAKLAVLEIVAAYFVGEASAAEATRRLANAGSAE